MTVTTMSSREFNQDTGRAKHAAEQGPVLITDRGRYSHVLLSFAEFQRLSGQQASIAEMLAMPAAADGSNQPDDLDVVLSRARELPRPADLA